MGSSGYGGPQVERDGVLDDGERVFFFRFVEVVLVDAGRLFLCRRS